MSWKVVKYMGQPTILNGRKTRYWVNVKETTISAKHLQRFQNSDVATRPFTTVKSPQLKKQSMIAVYFKKQALHAS